MTTLALILIVGLAGVWIILPLTRGETELAPPERDEAAELEARRRELLLALQDLDFELQTGKLSAEDHADLRTRLQQEAVEVMRRIEALRPRSGRSRASAG